MSNLEDRITKLLDFPYGSYLMVRLEYVLICETELEAKIMRLIEMYMDNERRRLLQEHLNDKKNDTSKDQVINITKDVWASISHRLFSYDLYDQVKSENTLKQAIKSLEKKNFIRVKFEQASRYDAPKYQINVEVVQAELNKLKEQGKSGYQKLIPSNSDTLKKRHPQKLTPSEGQKLTPSEENLSSEENSRVSNSDTNSRSNNTSRMITEETTTDASASSQSQSTPEKKSDENTKPVRERKPAAPQTPKQTPPPVVKEPDLSHLSEQEQAIYATLRQKDQPIYLSWTQTKRTVYNNWLGSFGYGMSVDITDGILSAVKRFEPIQPTIEDFKSIRKYAIAQEQDRPEDKRYYKKRGFKMWDAAREYPNWKSQQDMDGQSEDAPKNNQKMSREELIAKALSFPTGLNHTSQQYQELQNCMMYLQPDDRAEVTRQRIAKQIKQQKQVSA